MSTRNRSLVVLGAMLAAAILLHRLTAPIRRAEREAGRNLIRFTAEDRKRWADLEDAVALIQAGRSEDAIGLLLPRHRQIQEEVVRAARGRMTGPLASVGDAIERLPTLHERVSFIKKTPVARNAAAEELEKLRYVNFLFSRARARVARSIDAPKEVRAGSFSIRIEPVPAGGPPG